MVFPLARWSALSQKPSAHEIRVFRFLSKCFFFCCLCERATRRALIDSKEKKKREKRERKPFVYVPSTTEQMKSDTDSRSRMKSTVPSATASELRLLLTHWMRVYVCDESFFFSAFRELSFLGLSASCACARFLPFSFACFLFYSFQRTISGAW